MMPSREGNGSPARSKIAGIWEYSTYLQTAHTLGAEAIDLSARSGFARHTLVGLNLFFLKMAEKFPSLLGIRPANGSQDPMLLAKGRDPLLLAEDAMIEQAAKGTANIAVLRVGHTAGGLDVTVRVANKTGHKFPSGVGFRRAFLEFDVLDDNGVILWASGRTNGAGVIVDGKGSPVSGEYWWTQDCSSRIDPTARMHQPHYQRIDKEDQVQIYQELVSTPPSAAERRTANRARLLGAH